MTNEICLKLLPGESQLLTVNGVPCRFIRRDLGPTERIEFQACVDGYASTSRGSNVAQLSFWPMNRTEPMWEVV